MAPTKETLGAPFSENKDTDLYGLIRTFDEAPCTTERKNKIIGKLGKLDGDGRKFYTDGEHVTEVLDGETILHTAVAHLNEAKKKHSKIFDAILERIPCLVLQNRQFSAKYRGQTPFHMAVCKGNVLLVNKMLAALDRCKEDYTNVMEIRATGVVFENTAMMGELPLTVAALTGNIEMIELLLGSHADIAATNSRGDNVIHSLIRYAYLYEDKLEDVKETFKCVIRKAKGKDRPKQHGTGNLSEETKEANTQSGNTNVSKGAGCKKKLEDKRSQLLCTENNDGLTPLQLTAKHGLSDLFQLIMEEKQVYCFSNTNDGLFDVKVYDMTEVDAISSMETSELAGKNIKKEEYPEKSLKHELKTEKNDFQASVLMILFDIDPDRVFGFLQYTPISYVITKKWDAYKRYFYAAFLLYTLFLVLITVHAVFSSNQTHNSNNTFDTRAAPNYERSMGDDTLITTLGGIGIFVAILFLFLEARTIRSKKMPYKLNAFLNPYSNQWFRLLLLAMALCLIADFPARWAANYENYCIIFAVIFGWFFMLFFLRAVKLFAFFSMLVQRVLLDIGRFSVILALEIFAFGTAMYMLLQGSDVPETDPNFSGFFRTLATMVNLMVGLGDLPNFYSTREPGLIITVFVAFIVMTTLLMINALIALMGDTCTSLVQHGGSHDYHWEMQRLSTILFIESVLPNSWIKRIGDKRNTIRFNKASNQMTKLPRYMLQIVSLQSGDSSKIGEALPRIKTGYDYRKHRTSGRKKKPKTPRTKVAQAPHVHEHCELDIYTVSRACHTDKKKGEETQTRKSLDIDDQ